MSAGFDLKKLSDTSDPEFINNIHKAYLNITKDQIEEYFVILGNHFSGTARCKYTSEILTAIAAGLGLENSGDAFEQSGVINLLPFNSSRHIESILDILYFAVNKCPTIFDDPQIVAKFSRCCDESPQKALMIIALFSQQFDAVKEPMHMLNILFHKSQCFKTPECANNYVSILLWLLRNYEEFREQRLQHCWTYLCDMLRSTSSYVINAAYKGMCATYEINPELVKTYGYPSEAVACHIQHKSTQQATLSLLLRYLPLPTAKYIDQIVISLSELATKNDKAILLLLELATDENISKILIDNPSWMTKGMPKELDTLRLFGVVALHKNLRSKIVQLSETIKFFQMLLQVKSIGVFNAVCTIMKKLHPTPEFIDLLSSSGFLSGYFSVSYEIEDMPVRKSALKLLEIISKIKFVPEFMDMIPLVVELCKNENELTLPATNVMSKLARYPKCAKEFKEHKIDEFFKNPVKDPMLDKYRKKVLRFLQKC